MHTDAYKHMHIQTGWQEHHNKTLWSLLSGYNYIKHQFNLVVCTVQGRRGIGVNSRCVAICDTAVSVNRNYELLLLELYVLGARFPISYRVIIHRYNYLSFISGQIQNTTLLQISWRYINELLGLRTSWTAATNIKLLSTQLYENATSLMKLWIMNVNTKIKGPVKIW